VEGIKQKVQYSMEKQNVQFSRHPEGKRSHETRRNVLTLETIAV